MSLCCVVVVEIRFPPNLTRREAMGPPEAGEAQWVVTATHVGAYRAAGSTWALMRH